MDIYEAIKVFQDSRQGRFSPRDHQSILDTVEELGLVEFDIKIRDDVITKSGVPYHQFIFDQGDVLHIHPTMMVSRRDFTSRDTSKVSRYRTYPYFMALSNWITLGNLEPIPCPKCFIYLPVIGRCDTCEFDLEDID